MSPSDADCADYLHSLGYLYLRSGQESRALTFLLIANRIAPDDPGILRSLSAGFIAIGAGERAIGALDRLAAVEGELSSSGLLMRSRAQWALGNHVEARRCFRDYLERRRAA